MKISVQSYGFEQYLFGERNLKSIQIRITDLMGNKNYATFEFIRFK